MWDLSQNVDRSDPRRTKLGICPCLTPSLYAIRCLRSRLCLVPRAAGPVLRNRCRESSLASVRNLCAAMKVRIRDESWRADRRNRDARIAGCMKARNLFVRRAMAAHISECRTQCMRAPCDGTRHGQGIPIDDLLLTRERENQLTSLSGNAMTTTVILCRPPTHSSHAPQLSALRCCSFAARSGRPDALGRALAQHPFGPSDRWLVRRC